jgi:hypothetical protein
MLRVIFEQHPSMAVPPESYFPVSFHRQRKRYETAAGFDLGRWAEDLLAHERFRGWKLDQTAVREHLHGVSAEVTYADAVRRTYALYAEVHGKTRYGDKTPPFLMHMERLADLFDEARFVHLVRDGRSVGLSLRDWEAGPDSIAGAADHWASRVRLGRQAGARLGERRYREFRYEDLVDDPERTLRAMCDFVELDFRPEMLEYRREEVARIPVGYRHSQGGEGLSVNPPKKGVRDWRTEMTPKEQALFEAVAGEELDAFGYERAFPEVPASARARAAVFRAKSGVSGAAKATGRKLKRRGRAASSQGPDAV